MSENILEVKDLSVVRNGHTILENVSFNVEVGDTLAIIGPNGAGKTTLFRAILNLIPYTGVVTWKEDIRIGYVPQKLYVGNDLPLTTLEFLRLKDSNFENIKSSLFSVGLNDKGEYIDSFEKHILQSRLGDLSGGELQRVLIAWSLLGSPNVLLFDEPTSGVDVVGEETVYTMLGKLKTEHNLTILLISHELDIVEKHTSKVLCLNKENICYGPPLKVMSKEVIDKLFREEVHLYKHKHHKHHHGF
jgi:zinc transport system ATP-binding protein